MKNEGDNKKMKIAAKALEGIIAATDLSGQLKHNDELIEFLQSQSAHELIIENIKPQKSITDLQIEKKDALDSALSQAYDLRKKENDLTKKKNDIMDTKKDTPPTKKEILEKKISENKKDVTPTKKEILEKKISENKKDVTPTKKEILEKKISENKKDVTPTKKEILEKKFSENKIPNPTKKEITEKKIEIYDVNKKDILGDKGLDKKGPDKINTEHKVV